MSIVKAENTIPILVGITGHRTIRKQDYDSGSCTSLNILLMGGGKPCRETVSGSCWMK